MATKLVYRRCNRSTCRKCSADPQARPHGPYVIEKTYIGLGVSKNGNVQPQYVERYAGKADKLDLYLNGIPEPKPEWTACAWCGRIFKKKRYWQSYCDTSCRNMAYQRRKREFKDDYVKADQEGD